MFLFQLSQFKRWLMRGPTDAEQARIHRILSSMHWAAHISYEGGKVIDVRWYDCGFDRHSFCLLPDEPTTNFSYTRPEDGRDPVLADRDSYAPAVCVLMTFAICCGCCGTVAVQFETVKTPR